MNSINTYPLDTSWYTQNASNQKAHRPRNNGQDEAKSNPLDALVNAGTITQDQENSIMDVFKTRKSQPETSANRPQSPLDSLVTQGKITQDQENAIKSAFEAGRNARHNVNMKENAGATNPLDSLVSAGTISSDQEKAIMSAFQDAMKYRQAQNAYKQDSAKVNPLDTLVKAGTITQDQENSIKNALETEKTQRPHHRRHGGPPPQGGPSQAGAAQSGNQTNPLDSLVKAGAITQDQENLIVSTFDAAIKAYQAQSMTSYANNASSNNLNGLMQA